MTATQPEKLQELLDLLESLDDREMKSQVLIEYAERFRDVPKDVAARPFKETHRVPACESEAFIWAVPQDGSTLKFYFAVENPQGISAKAMAVILDETLSGEPLEQVADVDPDIIYKIFGREITMGRGQGLMGMVSMVRAFAARGLSDDGD